MHLIKRIPLKGWLLALIIFLIPVQRGYVYIFPSSTFSHTGCPYNWIKSPLFDVLLLLLFPLVAKKRSLLLKERPSLLMLGFFALCALSVFTHTYGTHLLPAWFLIKLLGTSLLFFALVIESKTPSYQDLLKLLQYTLLLAATLQAGIALLQFLKQSSLGLSALGEGVINPSRGLGATFPIGDHGRYLLEKILLTKKALPHLVRAQGTLDHPNHLGIFLVLGLTALSSLYLQAKKRARLFLLLPYALLCSALITTFSRASLFTYLLLLTITALFLKKKSLPLLTIALPLLLACGILLYPQIKQRGGIISSTAVNKGADQERISYQSDALSMIRAHPLHGVGFHNYVAKLPEYSSDPHSDLRPLVVHNIFLLIAAELGLPALFLFLALWALLLNRALIHRRDATTCLFGALLFSLLFYGCCDVFLLSEQQGQLILFFTLGTAYLSTAAAAAGEGTIDRWSSSISRKKSSETV